MKTQKTLKTFALLLVMTLVSFSCSDDDDNNPITQPMALNIVETAVSVPDLSILVNALQMADGDLVSVLNGNGPFTVLAPTNEAFMNFLDANNFASLSDVPTDVLSQVLLNHVITGSVPSSALAGQGSGYAKTNAMGAGDNYISLYFDTSNGVRFNNVASVIDGGADVSATNGIVHVIDAVIGLPSVVDHALANPNFSNLTAALGAADGNLVDVLSSAGPFTVLAPGNMAFGEFLTDNNFSGLGDVPTDALANVLLNHVLTGVTTSTDLVNAESGYTSTNAMAFDDHMMSLYFNASNGVMFNGKSMVVAADVVGTNGIIHAVDAVIGLPTVVDFAIADPNFETLVAALTRSDLTFDYVSTLSTPYGSSPAPFTVFAPTNDAFGDLLTELGVNGLADIAEPTLKATLDHHAVAGLNVKSTSLSDDFTVPTLGGNITANITGGASLTDANNRVSNIIAVDVQASNGVIHVINKVVLPPLN